MHLVGFKLVADLDVVELLNGQATVKACLDFLDVILEAAQGCNLAVVLDDAIANYPDAGI